MAKSSHRTLSVAVACAKPFAQSSNFGGEPVPVQRVLAAQFETSSTLFFMIGTQTLGSSYGRIKSGDFSAKPTDAVGPQASRICPGVPDPRASQGCGAQPRHDTNVRLLNLR